MDSTQLTSDNMHDEAKLRDGAAPRETASYDASQSAPQGVSGVAQTAPQDMPKGFYQRVRRRLRSLAVILGPAFVAAVAYVDPGNVSANLSAGAQYGYLLVWILVLANAMSVFIQYQSAKLGIVTGNSLPELLGSRLRLSTRVLFLAQAEVVAVVTDLAEVIGGAVALQLLFGMPLLLGGTIIGLLSSVLLMLQGHKTQRQFEWAVVLLLAIIAIGFVAGALFNPPAIHDVVSGLVPRFSDAQSVLLASSILGATVMPHAIYLHSTLVNHHYGHSSRTDRPAIRTELWGTKIDVLWALIIAGSVNLLLLLIAAHALFGVQGTDTLQGAYHAIVQAFGPGIAWLFAVGLLASSLASTSVGTYAGQEIVRGLCHVSVPMWACRIITLVPALVILAVGVDPTQALVVGQAILSVGIPFAIIPLARYTRNRSIMGTWANGRFTAIVFAVITILVVMLNMVLIVLTVMGIQ